MVTITDEMKLVIIAQVENAIAGMEDWEDAVNSAGDEVEEMVKKSETELKQLEKTIDQVANGMMVWTGAVAAGGVAGLKFAGGIESQKVAFDVLTGSMDTAVQLYEDLENLSVKTPLEPDQVNESAEALLTFQFAVSKVDDELIRLGNLAKGKPEVLDTITTAYGRMHLKGKASMEELNMLTEAGVPILAELSKQYGIATDELMDMVSKGKVGFSDIEQAVTSMTSEGGQFHGMMEKMSQTLDGKLSTALGSLKLALADTAEDFVPVAKDMLEIVAELSNEFRELDDNTKKAILTALGISATVGPALKLSVAIGKNASNMKLLFNLLKGAGPLLTSPWGALALAVGSATAAIVLHRQKMRETIEEYQEAVATSEKVVMNQAAGDWLEFLGDWESLDTSSLEDYVNASNKNLRSLGSSVRLTRQDIIQLINDTSFIDESLIEQLGITDEELVKIENFNNDLGIINEALERLGRSTKESAKSWEEWFDEITGVDPNDFTGLQSTELGNKGAQAAREYLKGLNQELSTAKNFSTDIGQVFDPTPYLQKQKGEIEAILRSLWESGLFDFSGEDQSINTLTAGLKEIDVALAELGKSAEDEEEAVTSLFQKLYMEEASALAERAEALKVYESVQLRLNDAMITGHVNEAQIYQQILESLEAQYDFKKDSVDLTAAELAGLQAIAIELDITIEKAALVMEVMAQLPGLTAAGGEALVDFQAGLEDVLSQQTAADAMADSFTALGEAMAEGTSLSDALAGSFKSFMANILNQIGTLAIGAGLRVIMEGGLAGLPIGLSLIALGGISLISSGIFGASSSQSSLLSNSDIIAAEEELHKVRMENLRDELSEAKDARDEGLKELEKYIDREYDLLKDQWDRNLISTDEFKAGIETLNSHYDTQADILNAPVDEAEQQIQAEEFEKAKTDKLALLEAIKQELLPDFVKIIGGTYYQGKEKADEVMQNWMILQDRISAANAATTIAEVEAAATGADFISNGPGLLLYGDNPGGKERVQVTPISSPNINGPQEKGSTAIIQGDVYGIDDLYGKLKAAGFRLKFQGRD